MIRTKNLVSNVCKHKKKLHEPLACCLTCLISHAHAIVCRAMHKCCYFERNFIEKAELFSNSAFSFMAEANIVL
ncbi:MAG: hypothetical protein CSA05_01580 [Bacteroidia bacterium]|nr:MAG: hypothetical protein CSA05_01580 [Bacteroidia bacterium]